MIENLSYRLKRLYHPELYQGPLSPGRITAHRSRLPRAGRRRTGYFEGWYYKFVFPNTTFAVIPGVSYARDDAHSFVQTLSDEAGSGTYQRYSVDAFRFERSRFSISIGPNRFTINELRLRLPEIEADLSFRPQVRWPSRLFSPSSMGWYGFLRFMECYHGILVVDGIAEGRFNGTELRDGRVYIEKDWGSSFPVAWIWLQTNSFDGGGALTCSVARVPFCTGAFTGFIAGLHDGTKLHRFATYTGAGIEKLTISDVAVEIGIVCGARRLAISATRSAGGRLVSPVEGAMEGRISESLDARISVQLTDNGRTEFAGTGIHAGLEVVNPEKLTGLEPT